MQARKFIFISVVSCILCFAIGLIMGHYGIPKTPYNDCVNEEDEEHLNIKCSTTKYAEKWKTYRKSYLDKAVSESCRADSCNTEDLPRTYNAYHLNGQTVTIDGKLDDPAWQEVPWTQSFMDIRGPDYPEPYFETRVKVRWDDQRLYIGARMEENNFWGTFTQDESLVWKENAFEVYAVPDGSLHNYKEMQISVRNVTWDLMLKKAYLDFGTPCDNSSAFDSDWDSGMEKGTYTDGVVNDPSRTGTFWTAEWSFSFEKLAENTDRPADKPTPETNEAWFFIFARPQYQFKIINGEYQKNEDAETEWWSWQPMHTVNLHLPSRFGLVQFKRDMNDKTFYFDKWHLYTSLFEVFEAEHKYKSVNGMFIEDLTKLYIAPKIMSADCVRLSIKASDTSFTVSAVSNIDLNLPAGHIREDRYVWFSR